MPSVDFLRRENLVTVAKAVGFWAILLAVLIGLRQVSLPTSSRDGSLIAAVVIIAVSLLLIRFLLRKEGGEFRDVGLRIDSTAATQFFTGTGLGLALVAVMMATLWVLTPLQIDAAADRNIVMVLGVSFVVIFILALMEEIAFRSYSFFRLGQAWGIRPAVYVSTVAFAFYHGLAVENLLGPGVWGLFYAWMAFKTNSIALPTGFHFGLNWMQALLGMKPQYGGSIWELSVASTPGLLETETMGVTLQVILLIVGVVLVERLIAKQRG